MDTAAKRQSALTFGMPFKKGIIPDGSLDQADRQTAAFSYGGILADVFVPPVNAIVDTISIILNIKRSESMTLVIKTTENIKLEG